METFKHNGQSFIAINGKDYFLLRGYQVNWGKWLLIQVSGATPLHKEDLPHKGWEVIITRQGSQRVWTAFHKSYFEYEKQAARLAFLGATTEGSYFLALRHLVRMFREKAYPEALYQVACSYARGKQANWRLTTIPDLGNSGTQMVLVEMNGMDEEMASAIWKGG